MVSYSFRELLIPEHDFQRIRSHHFRIKSVKLVFPKLISLLLLFLTLPYSSPLPQLILSVFCSFYHLTSNITLRLPPPLIYQIHQFVYHAFSTNEGLCSFLLPSLYNSTNTHAHMETPYVQTQSTRIFQWSYHSLCISLQYTYLLPSHCRQTFVQAANYHQ